MIDRGEILETAERMSRIAPERRREGLRPGVDAGRHLCASRPPRQLGLQGRHLPQETLLRDLPLLRGSRLHCGLRRMGTMFVKRNRHSDNDCAVGVHESVGSPATAYAVSSARKRPLDHIQICRQTSSRLKDARPPVELTSEWPAEAVGIRSYQEGDRSWRAFQSPGKLGTRLPSYRFSCISGCLLGMPCCGPGLLLRQLTCEVKARVLKCGSNYLTVALGDLLCAGNSEPLASHGSTDLRNDFRRFVRFKKKPT